MKLIGRRVTNLSIIKKTFWCLNRGDPASNVNRNVNSLNFFLYIFYRISKLLTPAYC
ncbi:hypothetical protein CpB0419 [Chlamydia pneumoniae TW-183]|uniref:Uncharacterized protein n=1 Tax=Chlamydia pneumoniae TaxID=83558 RepID=A0ABM5LCN3_CHLPN|nr:hypothetical protein CpB0419 [Chlamydia pneumoniae TW-183]